MKRNLFIFILVLAVVLPVLPGNWGLTESSEARYAEISREMYLGGDYIHPTLLGIKHLHKPPVTYYITAAGYSIFGVNELGARSFLLIALLLQLFFVYRIAYFLYKDRDTALAALLIYFSFPIAQVAAKNLTTDCYLTTFIFAGIFCYLSYKTSFKKIWLYLFYASCGLAFLTKGPVGVLPQALFAIVYGLLYKQPKRFNLHNILALLLGIITGFSWFALLLYYDPKLLDYFVGHQLVDRVSSNNFERTKPFWYYFMMMPLLGLPAIIFFAGYGLENIKKFRFSNRANKLSMTVLVISFVVFSLSSSKLVLYVLPLYLFIALVSARYLSVASPARIRLFSNIITLFFVVLLIVPVIGMFVPHSFILPAVPILLFSITGIASLILARIKTYRLAYLRAPLCAAVGMLFLVMVLSPVMNANEPAINVVKPLAGIIKDKDPRGEKNIIVYDQLLPSLEFYTRKKIITVYNDNSRSRREVQFENDTAAYKKYYFQLPGDSARLAGMGTTGSYIIITKKNTVLPAAVAALKSKHGRMIQAGEWIIHY
jgi:4-amino-4-deoxy-L-arabinose transferase-like glycosyltransferase